MDEGGEKLDVVVYKFNDHNPQKREKADVQTIKGTVKQWKTFSSFDFHKTLKNLTEYQNLVEVFMVKFEGIVLYSLTKLSLLIYVPNPDGEIPTSLQDYFISPLCGLVPKQLYAWLWCWQS